MTVNKHIMTYTRNYILQKLKERGETNENGLQAATIYCTKSAIRRALNRFSELGLITYTGGGYFEISEKGKEYLMGINR